MSEGASLKKGMVLSQSHRILRKNHPLHPKVVEHSLPNDPELVPIIITGIKIKLTITSEALSEVQATYDAQNDRHHCQEYRGTGHDGEKGPCRKSPAECGGNEHNAPSSEI